MKRDEMVLPKHLFKSGRFPAVIASAAAACAFLAALVYVVRARASSIEGWESGPGSLQTVSIIEAYERVLARRPTGDELISVQKRLSQDPTFSLDILEKLLVLSAERKRAHLTQSNAIDTEMEGIATREQVRLHIWNVYIDQTGREPTDDLAKFLYAKFIESEMDEHELLRLVRSTEIVPLAGNPFALSA
jgi:hypothetical protein